MFTPVLIGAALPAVDFDVAMEVASHEALIRQTYKDSIGKLTWCVGMTKATGHTSSAISASRRRPSTA